MDPKMPDQPQVRPHDPKDSGTGRDPEDRPAAHLHEVREKNLDKTLADSFPTSDPPSSIPDPVAAHSADHSQAAFDTLIANLPPGSWAVVSEDETRVLATGATREEAVHNAGGDPNHVETTALGRPGMRVVRVPQDPDAPEQAA